MNHSDRITQIVDLTTQNIELIGGNGVFWTRCADCNEKIKARYCLENGKIPAGKFAINHKRKGRNPCSPTIVIFDTNAISGADDTVRITTPVSIEDAFGNRYGSYPCFCGDTVQFTVEKESIKKTSHKHEKCGLISYLLLKFHRRFERRTDIHDHVIIPIDSHYAVMGKITDYSKGGANIKLPLKKQDQEKLAPYFEQDKDVQIIQYKGDIGRSDFPYPYKMNREDFGFTVLKTNGKIIRDHLEDRYKIYKHATVINYAFNPKNAKTELRLKFR